MSRTAVTVCPLAELPAGSLRRVEAGGRAVVVVNVEGEVFAVDDTCLHKGAALSEGRLHGHLLQCPLHWWRYDVRTGERVDSPGVRLGTHPARVEAGTVVVDVEPAPPPRSMREVLLAHARGEDLPG